jgi:hypothetical protein
MEPPPSVIAPPLIEAESIIWPPLFTVMAWVPMVRVPPVPMVSTAPEVTVRDPMFAPEVAFKLTGEVMVGSKVPVLMVTAEVVVGTAPVFQLVVVVQAIELVPSQVTGDA